MRPVTFGGTMGFLHEGSSGRGIVIAGSLGFEDLCSRRFLSLIARRAAALGIPALEFDYPGCGNGIGDHEDPTWVAAWIDSIAAAIDKLKCETGVREVVVVGFRLGALLAAHAVYGRTDVTGLALLAPPVSGRSFMREQMGLSRMIDATLPGGAVEAGFDGLQAAGFRYSLETVDAVNALVWPDAERLPRHSLLLMKSETAAEARLGDSLASDGAELRRGVFGGYAKLMCDPTANVMPGDVIEACASWLASLPAPASFSPLEPARNLPLIADDYEEEPVVIGASPAVTGVYCRPTRGARTDHLTIILNSGGVPNVGWARGSVELARALAAGGAVSLRVDLPGLGQSDATGENRVFLYDARVRHDIVRIIDEAERRGYRRIGLAGICAGAYQAFQAARIDRRVDALTMINPLCFRWNASYALDLAMWKTYESSKVVLGHSAADASDHGAWGNGLGRRMVKRVTRLLRRGLETLKTLLRALPQRDHLFGNPVERWMRGIAARGAYVSLVTSVGDLSNTEIARHFGPDGARLASIANVARLSLPDADHTLTPRHARAVLAAHMLCVIDGLAAKDDSLPVASSTGIAAVAATEAAA